MPTPTISPTIRIGAESCSVSQMASRPMSSTSAPFMNASAKREMRSATLGQTWLTNAYGQGAALDPSLLGRRGLGDQGVVDLAGADGGRAALQPVHIGLPGARLRDRAELQAPADVGAEIEVCGAEAAGQIFPALDRGIDGGHHVAVRAPAGHA